MCGILLNVMVSVKTELKNRNVDQAIVWGEGEGGGGGAPNCTKYIQALKRKLEGI